MKILGMSDISPTFFFPSCRQQATFVAYTFLTYPC